MSVAFLISCEHAVNAVPPAHARLFTDAALLTSHRGWDPGALDTAKAWASALNAPLFAASVTRLLCDCNRSPSNPSVWSSVTRALPPAEKNAILAAWHAPYRTAVGRSAAELLQTHARVLHLAAHSFTPILDGQRRNMDLGLLYDPSRPAEKSLAGAWRRNSAAFFPNCGFASTRLTGVYPTDCPLRCANALANIIWASRWNSTRRFLSMAPSPLCPCFRR